MSGSLLAGPSLLQLHFELLVECCGETEQKKHTGSVSVSTRAPSRDDHHIILAV